MSQAQIPITFSEVLNVRCEFKIDFNGVRKELIFDNKNNYQVVNPPLSVNAENVKFGTCSMESDKYITICESVGGVAQIATIDMTAGNTITRQKISAEAAIMNPNSKIIALKGIESNNMTVSDEEHQTHPQHSLFNSTNISQPCSCGAIANL